MHPVIKILSVLIISGFAAQAEPFVLLAAAGSLLLSHIVLQNVSILNALRMLRRLRIFFISILILYGWFTPGTPIFHVEHLSELVPGREGLIEGSYRIAALCIMIWAVSNLLQSCRQEELLSALVWLLRPLAVFNNLHERLAVRMTLVLQNVGKVSEMITRQRATQTEGRNKLTRLVNAMARVFHSVLQQAESQPTGSIAIEITRAPAWFAWLIPLGLLIVFAGISAYG
jgi:energy-coupling factor transport system permease protein